MRERNVSRFLCGLIGALALITVRSDQVDSFSKADVYQHFGPAVARLDFSGELHDGSWESSPGTAFLVSDTGLALTCNHVIPPLTNYKSWKLTARFRSLKAEPVVGEVIWRDSGLDVALVRVTVPADAKPLVLSAEQAASLVPGTDIIALGFPIDLDLSVSPGTVNVRRSAHQWVIDAALNPGNSGGPIFGRDGRIVGIAWGAAIRWVVGTSSVPLEGIRYFVAADKIWEALPPEQRNLFATSVQRSLSETSVVRVSDTIDITKSNYPVTFDAHTRTYAIPFRAEAGYRIVAAKSTFLSAANMSGYELDVAPDGGSAIARFTLKSGPQDDQWRGWLKATVELEQEIEEK